MQRVCLIILDGFGVDAPGKGNAIAQANAPFLQKLFQQAPQAKLLTHGEAVGLPEGTMGNSEVGHMTIGSGRIIRQDLSRINHEIKTGQFFENPVLLDAIRAKGRLHLIGLLSDGGVHSHIDHLLALLEACKKTGKKDVSVHAILDGRDTPPGSAKEYLAQLEVKMRDLGVGTIASVSGRYYAMDRDNRWDRVQKAYNCMYGEGETASSAGEAFQTSLDAGVTDEFMLPKVVDASACIRDGDHCLFFDYRADRMRQISAAIGLPKFDSFERNKPVVNCSTFSRYEESYPFAVLFPKQSLHHLLADVVADQGLSQLRIAETEKYAHVTYFLNGGQEQVRKNEERVLIDSPKDVATYDLKPEMSLPAVAKELVARLKSGQHDFIVSNFANADMVGHTGVFAAAVKAVEAIDMHLKEVVETAHREGYFVFISADHGNIETMFDSAGNAHTQHTLNPVPLIALPPGNDIFNHKDIHLRDGNLSDIMPTILGVMNIKPPGEVTGHNLLA